jgi:hypothetical protein
MASRGDLRDLLFGIARGPNQAKQIKLRFGQSQLQHFMQKLTDEGGATESQQMEKIMLDQTSRLMQRIAIVGAIIALSALGLLPIAAAQAQQQPPNCTDDESLKGIKKQYNGLEEINNATVRIKEIKNVKETYYGAAPQSFNQYANSNDRVLNVRWCQAAMLLNDGQGDTVYWFLADEQKGDRHSTVQDHCSTKHNLLDSTCAKWREHR